jgi:YHS domain-containing protein
VQSNHDGKDSPDRQFVTLCGRIFRQSDAAYFPRASYKGRALPLCTEVCLHAFEADSEAFIRAHRNGGHGFEGKHDSAVEVGRR